MTTSELVKANTTAVAIADDVDPFQAFADAVAPQYILGKLLKFSKGDWLAGENNEPVKQTSFIAGMHASMTGWVRWEDFKPVDHAMVSIGSRLLPPRRHELSDNDSSTWPSDDRGQPKDPRQFTSYLPMVAVDDGEIFTFTASSKGGLGALGTHRRRLPGELPIVSLAGDGYQHKRREYGWIDTPVFSVAGWASASRFDEAMALAGYDLHVEEPAPVEGAGTTPTAVKPNNDMDDDIPF